MTAKYLVIVESPAKAKTINKILGGDYQVKASMGHVRDLPEHALGVDIANRFEPRYEPIKGRAKVIQELQAAARGVECVYLAPDPDREGEAIAWHLEEILKAKRPNLRFRRVTYNEITAPAIREAFAHPGELNMRRVDSQQARRILDRVVGYKVSPHLWRAIHGARSAGRVQSVALRLVCEREAAIAAFKPEPYWIVAAKAAKQSGDTTPFLAKLARIDGKKAEVRDAALAESIMADLKTRGLAVEDILQREVLKRPAPPFITSSLQQAASGVLGFPPAKTMRIAQKLYEGVSVDGGPATGLITYMRTDSVAIAATARDAARRLAASLYGPEYVPEKANVYRNRSNAQEAHEAIRPTDPARLPEQVRASLEPDEWKLYALVWQRFMASQMAPARIHLRTAVLDATPTASTPVPAHRFSFRATASEVVFPGFMRASGIEKRRKDDAENAEDDLVDALPQLAPGERLSVLEWVNDRKETQPPPRYTEASLIKALEENGVGRPSTYAQTISTLHDRKYVSREKRSLVPTPLGSNVNAYLVGHLDSLFAVPFTAQMEAELDKIEEGGVDWRDMLSDFYRQFDAWTAPLKGPEVPRGDIEARLGALARIQKWAPPVERGKRTYSDERFAASLKRQFEAGSRPFSERQKAALDSLLVRYADQIPDSAALFARIGVGAAPSTAFADGEPAAVAAAGDSAAPVPDNSGLLAKLKLLENVQFNPPRTVGKRTYDDAAFCQSLREQAESGKALSPRQAACIDRLLQRYAAQLPGEAAAIADVPSAPPPPSPEETELLGRLFAWMDGVSEWKPVVERKGRKYDDREFFESLKKQYQGRKQLTPRQVSAFQSLVRSYLPQLPPEAAAALPPAPPRRSRFGKKSG